MNIAPTTATFSHALGLRHVTSRQNVRHVNATKLLQQIDLQNKLNSKGRNNTNSNNNKKQQQHKICSCNQDNRGHHICFRVAGTQMLRKLRQNHLSTLVRNPMNDDVTTTCDTQVQTYSIGAPLSLPLDQDTNSNYCSAIVYTTLWHTVLCCKSKHVTSVLIALIGKIYRTYTYVYIAIYWYIRSNWYMACKAVYTLSREHSIDCSTVLRAASTNNQKHIRKPLDGIHDTHRS